MSTDCLVLYIETISPAKCNPNGISNSMFIIYDELSSRFFLCGKSKSDDQNIEMKE